MNKRYVKMFLVASAICLAVQAFGQSNTNQLSPASLEERVFRQVDSLMFMIKLGSGIVTFIGIALAAWGVTSYRGLLKDIRKTLETRVAGLEKAGKELATNLEQSKTLVKEAQESLGLHKSAAPAVLLAQAEECFSGEKPDVAKAIALVSQLTRDSSATADELTTAGLMARQHLGSRSLAKRLLGLAVQKEDAPDLARAIHADLGSRDPQPQKHKKTLEDVIERNPYDESMVKAAGNFFIDRDDWPGLEEVMSKAAQRCPWLSTPHRCRARAAERMRRKHEDVVGFYEQAIACALQCDDAQAFSWYAHYLYNNGSPRSDADLQKAQVLFRQALQLDAGDGIYMRDLARTYSAQGKKDEAAKWLKMSLSFLTSTSARREAIAELAFIGALPPMVEVPPPVGG